MDAESQIPGTQWGRRMPAIFWAVFAAGLLLQLFSPHLKIEHNAFVAPPALLSSGKTINPSALVAKERTVQSLSAFLTIGGAIGLAWCYWSRLFSRSVS